MFKKIFIVWIGILLIVISSWGNASENIQKPCQSKYSLNTETDKCLDTGIE
jgi:hypothetical protein